MKRTIEEQIKKDLDQKIVLLSGPRQVGKTTVSKAVFPDNFEYFNLDSSADRLIIKKEAWKKDVDLIIFDELHKMKNWKNWLKGIYDTQGVRPRIFVTGSSRLDTYCKGGDSLAGRFFYFRLHPFSVAEVKDVLAPDIALERILTVGGFPEPFLKDSTLAAKRWQKTHIDRIIKEDIFDIASRYNIRGIETLVELLRQSVGSPIAYDSLARDLEISPPTVKQWISVLESLFIIFTITPYSKNIARSLKKQPKVYFYDTGYIKDEPGARLENAVACALLKRLHYLEDIKGEKCSLNYLKDKQKREVDFLTVRDGQPEKLIEVKSSEIDAKNLRHFASVLPASVESLLLVKDLDREQDQDRIKVRKVSNWLADLES